MSELFDYRTIVVGTDGSELAGPTVARAARLAARDNADLVTVCAYSALTRRQEASNTATTGGDSRAGQVLGHSSGIAALDTATTTARRLNANLTGTLLIDGEPAEALLQTADEYDADLIVIGALRDVSIADRLLGTVARVIVRRAPCDVLIVRPR